MSPPASAPEPTAPCPTRIHYSTLPTDLVTWARAAAELADGPEPMSKRNLARQFKEHSRRRTWRIPGQPGELVSMSDVWEFHRNYRRGWMTARP